MKKYIYNQDNNNNMKIEIKIEVGGISKGLAIEVDEEQMKKDIKDDISKAKETIVNSGTKILSHIVDEISFNQKGEAEYEVSG